MKVPVSEESKAAMLDACANKLPTKPEMQPWSADTYVEYDPLYGRANIRMSPAATERLVAYLDDAAANLPGLYEEGEDLAEELRRILEEHRNYTDTDEPGLTDGNTDGR